VDELTDSEGLSTTMTTKSMKSLEASASHLAHHDDDQDNDDEDDDEPHQQSALKTASVRFLDEHLESVHHFEMPSRESSEVVIREWKRDSDDNKTGMEKLRERTRDELQELRNADMTPPYYDSTWDD